MCSTTEWRTAVRRITARILRKPSFLILVFFVIVSAILALSLRGAVGPLTVFSVDGKRYVESVETIQEGVDESMMISLEGWKIVHRPQNTSVSVEFKDNILNVTAVFPKSEKTQSIMVAMPLNINLNAYPIMDVRLFAPSDTWYGIRFRGNDSFGQVHELWWEESPLDHKKGIDQWETLKANLIQHAFLASGGGVNFTLIRIGIYLEVPQGRSGTSSIQISKIRLYNPVRTRHPSLEISGNFSALMISLNDFPPLQDPSWLLKKVRVGFDVRGASLLYTIYVTNQFSVSKSYTYRLKSISSYEYPEVLIQEPGLDIFQYPIRSNLTIVFGALKGEFTYLNIEIINFVFEKTFEPSPDRMSIILSAIYYLLFVLLIPTVLIIVVYTLFKGVENISSKNVRIIAILGILTRLMIAPFSGHSYDVGIWAYHLRQYFENGIVTLDTFPTFPPLYYLLMIPYSYYAMARFLGFSDAHFLAHSVMTVESVFIKLPFIIGDLVIFYLLLNLFEGKSKGDRLVYASAFLFNPFIIFISSAWGTYDSLMLATLIGGLYALKKLKNNLLAGVMFAISGLIKIVGFLPLLMMFLFSMVRKRFKEAFFIGLTSFVITFLALVPLMEARALESILVRFILRLTGGSSAYDIPPYSTLSAFVSPLSPDVRLLLYPLIGVVLTFFLLNSRKNIELNYSILLMALVLGVAGVNLLPMTSPKYLGWLIPLMLLCSWKDEKPSLAVYSCIFGIASFILSAAHTQGFGYILVGLPYRLFLFEIVANAIKIYAVMVFSLILIVLFHLFAPTEKIDNSTLVSIKISIVILLLYLELYYWFGVVRVV